MGHKAEDQTQRKSVFKMKWRVSETCKLQLQLSFFFGDFNGHVGKCAEGFEDVHGAMVRRKELGKEMQKEDCLSSVMKKAVHGKHLVL